MIRANTFKAPIEETGIHMQWLTLGTNEAKNDVWAQHVKDGKFTYPDGRNPVISLLLSVRYLLKQS